MSSEKKLFLLDAYALIYRAYYAFIRNPRITSKGKNTSATFGFTNALLEIINKEKPSHMAVVFDPPTPTFRNELFTEYKANREETPEDIKNSVMDIKDIIEAFNLKILEVPGYEADDVIGTIAKKAAKKNFEVYMMTPDKDFCQLLDEKIFLYKPKRGANIEAEIWSTNEVIEKYGLENPRQFIDILALMGDAVDNIPGAPGIGEKTAQKLIAQYGHIEILYEKINQLKGKVLETLSENKDQVFLSKKLATIDQDVDIEFDEDQYIVKDKNLSKLQEKFKELEFNTILKRILQDQNNSIQTSLFDDVNSGINSATNLKTLNDIKHEYILVDSTLQRDSLLQQLSEAKEFAFDTETTSLNPLKAKLIAITFCLEKNKVFYIPFSGSFEQICDEIKPFAELFNDPNKTIIGQNIKYDLLVLHKYGIRINGKLFDTLIAHYLLQPDQKHNLDQLAESYLGYQTIHIEELIGPKGKNQKSMDIVPQEKLIPYACEDSDITFQLKIIFAKKLKENDLFKLFCQLEMPLIPVLAGMEIAGFKIDIKSLKDYSHELRDQIIIIEKNIFNLAGEEFNISSPKQLGVILFEKLQIDPNAKKTKTQQYSTSEEVLLKLIDKHPIINEILEYRSLKKLLSTYVEALPKLIDKDTNKIHSTYNQAVAATGRLSSNNPNLQNIPIRDARGREIRKAFVPSREENEIFSADYSQIELRLMAHMSGDEDLIQAFMNNEDIHTATAAKVYHVNKKDVTREMRSKAKTANFGIIYGISAFGLSQRLNISRKEAADLIGEYFQNYPGVKKYMQNSINFARENGYVKTMMDRKRYLNDINSRNAVVRGFAERNAINAPIQGSAADIIKKAMINIHKRFNEQELKSKMILQVHDELIFDVFPSESEKVKEIVIYEMEKAITLKVPLIVDSGSGKNWLDAH